MKKYLFLLMLLPVMAFAVDTLPEATPEVLAATPEVVTTVTSAPDWLVKTMEIVSSVPLVGPITVEVAKWLGVISSALTILVTALLGVLRVLALVLPAARLASWVGVLVAFENSKIMYWLKMLSMYNATREKKVEPLPKKP